MDVHLLRGCCVEAGRSDVVSRQLEGLRCALGDASDAYLTTVIEELKAGSRVLRELADLSQIYQDRVPLILEPLNIALPCLSRSLRDVTAYHGDRTRSKVNRWRTMYHKMTNEAGGLPLPGRFMAYNRYLSAVRDLLTRSPNFNLNMLEKLRRQIMQLREARSIPLPSIQAGPLVRYDSLPRYDVDMMQTPHWAEHIFPLPLPSRTALKRRHRGSKSVGLHHPWGHLDIPRHSKSLLRRCFNDDGISLTVYQSGGDNSPYMLLRILDDETPWFSVRGVHELCIQREDNSLQFKRWSRSEGQSKVWAVLCFMTWEELVLMHSTFVSLKARNGLTISLHPEEYDIRGEEKLFQACIDDDGFKHSLIVYQDRSTRGLRLHTAVWDGELRGCPVWTAFGLFPPSFGRRWSKSSSANCTSLTDTWQHSDASVCLADVARAHLAPQGLPGRRAAPCFLSPVPAAESAPGACRGL
ncbi:hypothetical protein OCS_02581 [Ophiocordyceps sinensis CO18]|uniref:Uncharacterized protein n=1 Tax=Ophiocordyceps sinensis (strain Co18 / CGMCC 3.14243) TaxID=911162 RepID=T5A8B5_OPHSC|nr:hypothetical protein OCS_02581 [Ophiocordyceps sinensis CO18]